MQKTYKTAEAAFDMLQAGINVKIALEEIMQFERERPGIFQFEPKMPLDMLVHHRPIKVSSIRGSELIAVKIEGPDPS